MKEINIMCGMGAHEQAPKTKSCREIQKFIQEFEMRATFWSSSLHKRISLVILSLICADNWQIQGLVQTVGDVSQQKRVLVVVCLSECVQKHVLPKLSTTANVEGFFLFVDVWNRVQFIASLYWMRHLIILPENDNSE
jgi:hypothetical protein